MRICIVGAGVVGPLYGQLFAEAGHEVTHFVRPGAGAALREGLPIDLVDARGEEPVERTVTYRPEVVETLDPLRPYNLMIVSVPHDRLRDLVPTLAARAGETQFLFAGNLWSSFDPIDAYLCGRYRWAFPMAGGHFEAGRLRVALLDEVRLGDPLGGRGSRLTLTRRLLEQCGLTVTVQPQMLDWLWVQFAIEAGLVATAATVGSVERLVDDPDALTESVLAVREALAVAAARGVDVRQRPEAAMFYAPERSVALSLHDLYAEDVAARQAVVQQLSRPDLRRVYRDLLATGRILDVATPLLATMEPYVDSVLVGSA